MTRPTNATWESISRPASSTSATTAEKKASGLLLEAVFPFHLGDPHAVMRVPVGAPAALRLGVLDVLLPGGDVFEAAEIADRDAEPGARGFDAEEARLLRRQLLHPVRGGAVAVVALGSQ